MADASTKLSRKQASDAVTGLGWRHVLGELQAQVVTGSLPLATEVAGRAAAVAGAEGHLQMDVRSDHFDVSVPHDEAQRRIQVALAVGGTLVNDGFAPAFWVLADPEGNEACVCTWQGRDA